MHLVLCLDQRDGRLFNNRRQSSDRCVRQDLLKHIGTCRLVADRYTADQFEKGQKARILTDTAPGNQDYYFLERGEVLPLLEKVSSVVIYRWDKVYPADTFLEADALKGFCLQEKTEIAGYSHKVITKEVYRREA